MPVLSVVIPAFNASATIARSLTSILNQTLADIEVIIVDDGSTDDTVRIVSRFRDSRIKLIQCDHCGVAQAANTGTVQAQAAIISRMDADDVSHPHRLEKQQRLIATAGVDVAGCRVRILNHDGSPATTMRRYERWINEETATSDSILALRFVEFPLVNPTITARRQYFELGFHDDDMPEDYELMLRAAAAGMTFAKVGDVLLDWFDGSQRLTRSNERYSATAFMKCRRQHLLQGPLSDTATVDLWGVGQTGKPWLKWLQSQNICVRRAIDVSPGKIGQTIHNVPVYPMDSLPLYDGTPLIIAVGADGARSLIEAHISKRGYISGHNAWFVA